MRAGRRSPAEAHRRRRAAPLAGGPARVAVYARQAGGAPDRAQPPRAAPPLASARRNARRRAAAARPARPARSARRCAAPPGVRPSRCSSCCSVVLAPAGRPIRRGAGLQLGDRPIERGPGPRLRRASAARASRRARRSARPGPRTTAAPFVVGEAPRRNIPPSAPRRPTDPHPLPRRRRRRCRPRPRRRGPSSRSGADRRDLRAGVPGGVGSERETEVVEPRLQPRVRVGVTHDPRLLALGEAAGAREAGHDARGSPPMRSGSAIAPEKCWQ